MAFTVPHLERLRQIPEYGQYLYEALAAVQQQSANIEQQANGNASGQPAAPPPLDSLSVTGKDGHFSIALQHNAAFSRGVRYYVEHDTSPAFTNPQVINLGDSRNHNVFLGNGPRYWRAYAAYNASAPSRPTYFGSAVQPAPVEGGGSIGPPAVQRSQGSGTGAAGQGLSGPGPVPMRSPLTGIGWK